MQTGAILLRAPKHLRAAQNSTVSIGPTAPRHWQRQLQPAATSERMPRDPHADLPRPCCFVYIYGGLFGPRDGALDWGRDLLHNLRVLSTAATCASIQWRWLKGKGQRSGVGQSQSYTLVVRGS